MTDVNQTTSMYIIGGTSIINPNETFETFQSFEVPSDCKIVTIEISEDEMVGSTLECYLTFYNSILKMDKHTLEHPNESLFEHIGKIHIYDEGSVCLNFEFYNFLYDNGEYIPFISGCTEISYVQKVHPSEFSIQTVEPHNFTDKTFISNMYKYSSIVNRDSVLTMLEKKISEGNYSVLLSSYQTQEKVYKKMLFDFINATNTNRIYYCFILRKTVPNVYLIGGHGEENINHAVKNTFIVPKGCTIVVGKQSAQIMTSDILSSIYEQMKILGISVLEHPIENISKLNKSIKKYIKSVAIYKEGDICPIFYYLLYSGGKLSKEVNGVLTNFNGVIDLHKQLSQVSSIDLVKSDSNRYPNTSNSLANFYKYSVYPTEAEVKLYNNKDTIYAITQSLLCYMHPGVYYNFVCRKIFSESTTSKKNKNISHLHKNSKITTYTTKPIEKLNNNEYAILGRRAVEGIIRGKLQKVTHNYNNIPNKPIISTHNTQNINANQLKKSIDYLKDSIIQKIHEDEKIEQKLQKKINNITRKALRTRQNNIFKQMQTQNESVEKLEIELTTLRNAPNRNNKTKTKQKVE